MAKVVSSATQTIAYSIATNNDGTVLLGGSDIYYSPYRTFVTKLNKDLTSAWVMGDSNSTGAERVDSLRYADAGNFIYSDYPKNTSSFGSIISATSTGSITWTRTLSGTGASTGQVALGAATDVYFTTCDAGNNNNATVKRSVIAKYNSSGTIQWQRYIDGGFTYQGSWGADANRSTGNVYKAYSPTATAGSAGWPSIAKFNSSGTLQWSRGWAVGNTAYQPTESLKLDASENVYWTGHDGGGNVYLYKLDASGTELWKRKFTLSGLTPRGLSVDGAGNAYIHGSTSSTVNVIKYNASGAIQWQRSMAITGQSLTQSYDATSQAANGTVAFVGHTTRAYYFRMPDDGSLTGAYAFNGETITWATTAGTDATATQTFATNTDTAGTSSATDAANSASNTTGTQTLTTRTIP